MIRYKMKQGVNIMTVVKSPKGSVRSFLLNELANGVELPTILLSLNEKGLKPGNAKLHLKKAMAQFKAGGNSAVKEEKKTFTREIKGKKTLTRALKEKKTSEFTAEQKAARLEQLKDVSANLKQDNERDAHKEAMQAELDAIVKESDEYVASLQSDFMRRMVYAD